MTQSEKILVMSGHSESVFTKKIIFLIRHISLTFHAGPARESKKSQEKIFLIPISDQV